MEAQLVLVFSAVGSIVNLLLLIDCWHDRRIVVRDHSDDTALCELTRHRLISESLRLVVQLALLTTAIGVVIGTPPLREAALTLLVAVPIILSAASIYSYIRRRRLLD